MSAAALGAARSGFPDKEEPVAKSGTQLIPFPMTNQFLMQYRYLTNQHYGDMRVLLFQHLEHGVRIGLTALDGELPTKEQPMAALMALVQGLGARIR